MNALSARSRLSLCFASLLTLCSFACTDDEDGLPVIRDSSVSTPDASTPNVTADASLDASLSLDAALGNDAATGPAGDAGLAYVVHTAAELARESANDYGSNQNGLISGSTLSRWLSGWSANKPAGISGKLVVLQIQPSDAPTVNHVTVDGVDTFTYAVTTSDLLQVRFTGLSSVEAIVPEGKRADALLKRFNIDPRRDLVVFAFEQTASTSNSIVQALGRGWLYLRYWGVEHEHLAVLNGSIDWNASNAGLPITAGATVTPPDSGTTTVKDLPADNTTLLISVGEVIDTIRDRPGAALPRAQARIIDARGGAEAYGLRKATSTGKTDCDSYTGTAPNAKCSPAFEGRLKGARSLPWTQFLEPASGGFRFFDKAKLKALFDQQAEATPGLTYIQYCRTNQRSQVTGLISSIILGYATRFYDTSFIEWSHLAHGPTPRTQVLAADSPFRTDVPELTEYNEASGYTPGGASDTIVPGAWVAGPNYNLDADISKTPIEIVANPKTTAQIQLDDQAYKRR